MIRNPLIIFILLLAIYFVGFGIDVMDVDASQYAAMSREMMASGSYLRVYDNGIEYLDKPPFLFWVSALSMKIFGVNNFGYRLPSLLFALLAVLSTFKLARLFYEKNIALWAAIVLAGSQGFFLMTHDVRTDTILMGCVAFSTWQWAAWMRNKQWLPFLFGCIGIACGMMTKGPIALLVPAFALGSHLLLQRDFKNIFRWEYIPALLIVAALLIPMSYGLYQQFDLHPEKTVNGKTGVSGLRFFYWTQSFGRITGESPWNNGKGIFFLMQNMLWSFLPWILFFLAGFILQVKTIVQQRLRLHANQEGISTGGFLLSYLALGSSNYQLPHYIFVAFPFAAIITAVFLNDIFIKGKHLQLRKILGIVQITVLILLGIGLGFLLYFPFSGIPGYATIVALLALAGWVYWYVKNRKLPLAIPVSSLAVFMGINLMVNLFFYPALLKYQAGSSLGRFMRQQQVEPAKTYLYHYQIWRSLNFYANGNMVQQDTRQNIPGRSYVITTPEKMTDFGTEGNEFTVLYRGVDYPVSRLKGRFLNPKTREKMLRRFVLISLR